MNMVNLIYEYGSNKTDILNAMHLKSRSQIYLMFWKKKKQFGNVKPITFNLENWNFEIRVCLIYIYFYMASVINKNIIIITNVRSDSKVWRLVPANWNVELNFY